MTEELSYGAVDCAADLFRELGGAFPRDQERAFVGLNAGMALEIRILGEHKLQLLSPILEPGEPQADNILKLLLEANYLWQDSRGAVFGWDLGLPVLVQVIDLTGAGYAEFRLGVENFLNSATTWKHRLGGLVRADASTNTNRVDLEPAGEGLFSPPYDHFR